MREHSNSTPPGRIIDFADIITRARAHNSRVYAFMAEQATLRQVGEFLSWDAAQPSFVAYLGRGLEKLPPALRPALAAHIDEEVSQDHAGLWREMLAGVLAELAAAGERDEAGFVLDHPRLARLYAPLSPAYVDRHPLGYFLGGFMATERMNQKRSAQLIAGLTRLGSRADRRYLELHAEADAHHWLEVRRDLVWPAIAGGFTSEAEVLAGVEQRLDRSSEYLDWYGRHRLGLPD